MDTTAGPRAPYLAPRVPLPSLTLEWAKPVRVKGGRATSTSADGWSWPGLAAHQQILFSFGFLVTNDDVEPYLHCVPESPQGLQVRRATTQLDAR